LPLINTSYGHITCKRIILAAHKPAASSRHIASCREAHLCQSLLAQHTLQAHMYMPASVQTTWMSLQRMICQHQDTEDSLQPAVLACTCACWPPAACSLSGLTYLQCTTSHDQHMCTAFSFLQYLHANWGSSAAV
jgi:hypothetical protein